MTFVCVPCKIEMRCESNGVLLVSMDARNEPAEAFAVDVYYCPECKSSIAEYRKTNPVAAGTKETKLTVDKHGPGRVERFWLNKREKEQAHDSEERTESTGVGQAG